MNKSIHNKMFIDTIRMLWGIRIVTIVILVIGGIYQKVLTMVVIQKRI